MESVIAIMKDIAAREAAKIYTTELGVVTAVFPHADEGDKDNYACSVKLKNRDDLELRQVPVATPHIGWANIPNVGDLVVLTFIGGDLNAPVIIGRLYNDEDRPPKNDKDQVVFGAMESVIITTKKGTKIEIDSDGNVTIDAGDGDVVINGGTKGAAREGDEVEVTIQAGTYIEKVTGQAAGVPNVAPLTVKGKITKASKSVKIGD